MATLLYEKIAKNLKNSPLFGTAWLVFTTLVLVGLAMGVEDYTTSLYGYAAYPTQKAIAAVVWLVAGLPQLLQMGAIYIVFGLWGTDAKDREWHGLDVGTLAFMAWGLCYGLDGYWDYLYKSAPYAPGWMGIYWPAVFESYGVYGLGSELILSISLGVWYSITRQGGFEAFVEVLVSIAEIIGKVIGLIAQAIAAVFRGLLSPFRARVGPDPRERRYPNHDSDRHPRRQR